MTSSRIFGIDLGTTYSCIACVDENGKAITLANFEGDATTPSVVYFESPDNIVVGKHAKSAAKLDPARVVSFVKRSMGEASFSFEADGKAHTPEMISSFVLRKVVNDASQALGEPITDVVITCPAYFGINQREATKNAGKLAGLNVRHVLNEPTAAAICYGLEKLHEDKTVLVYDLGGGTFDITVIALKGGDIQVIVTGGNHALGGKDWDDRLINYFAEAFMREAPAAGDPRDDANSLQDLATNAEEAKKNLSTREKWPFMVTHNGQRVRVELTREQFEQLTQDLLEQTVTLTQDVLREAAERGHPKIDQLLLVGGSSKMPAVSRRLQAALNLEPQLFDPDQAVAKGAALMGLKLMAGEAIKEEIAQASGRAAEEIDLATVDSSQLSEAASKVAAASPTLKYLPAKTLAEMAASRVVNVASKGFGIAALAELGGPLQVAYLLQPNTPVPAEQTEVFGTVQPDQRAVQVEVMEQAGQVPDVALENNRLIVQGDLEGLPAGLPLGAPVEVTFRLEEDGTLKVTAREPGSGRELKLQAQVEGVMSPEAIEAERKALARLSVS